MALHSCNRIHTYAHIHWLDLSLCCRKRPNWVWPSRLTKGKLMKTLWKADWFFSPFLHYIHRRLQYSRQERRQAAAELELITHLFNRLAEMRTEQQRMPENTPRAPFKWLGPTERRRTFGIWIGCIVWKSGNCTFWPFDRNKLKSFLSPRSHYYGFNLFIKHVFKYFWNINNGIGLWICCQDC